MCCAPCCADRLTEDPAHPFCDEFFPEKCNEKEEITFKDLVEYTRCLQSGTGPCATTTTSTTTTTSPTTTTTTATPTTTTTTAATTTTTTPWYGIDDSDLSPGVETGSGNNRRIETTTEDYDGYDDIDPNIVIE